jgi:structural maintenance of chromosome 2
VCLTQPRYGVHPPFVSNSRVQNLFHSVQLNVNNPHFLIMQGRITKVLNMKPPEILSMLEEVRSQHPLATGEVSLY